jgi:hypothetical protein
MFVRWKRRRLKDKLWRTAPAPWVRSAVLVESIRTADGSRQKHICYLGEICEDNTSLPWSRHSFWRSADKALDRVGVKGKQREAIDDALTQVVQRPTKSEKREMEAQWRKAHRSVSQLVAQLERMGRWDRVAASRGNLATLEAELAELEATVKIHPECA